MSISRTIQNAFKLTADHHHSPDGADDVVRDLIRLLARHAAHQWVEQHVSLNAPVEISDDTQDHYTAPHP
jgi:hypothetical protein